MDDIVYRIGCVIFDYLNDDTKPVERHTRFSADLNLSSLDMMAIAGDLEEIFDIEIEERAIVRMTTVADLEAYLKKKLSGR